MSPAIALAEPDPVAFIIGNSAAALSGRRGATEPEGRILQDTVTAMIRQLRPETVIETMLASQAVTFYLLLTEAVQNAATAALTEPVARAVLSGLVALNSAFHRNLAQYERCRRRRAAEDAAQAKGARVAPTDLAGRAEDALAHAVSQSLAEPDKAEPRAASARPPARPGSAREPTRDFPANRTAAGAGAVGAPADARMAKPSAATTAGEPAASPPTISSRQPVGPSGPLRGLVSPAPAIAPIPPKPADPLPGLPAKLSPEQQLEASVDAMRSGPPLPRPAYSTTLLSGVSHVAMNLASGLVDPAATPVFGSRTR